MKNIEFVTSTLKLAIASSKKGALSTKGWETIAKSLIEIIEAKQKGVKQ
jgi:hypothetical protein